MKPKTMFRRLCIYLTGLLFISIGIAFCKLSDLGLSPTASVSYVISEVFHTDLGLCTTLFMLFLMMLEFAILRREFPIKNLFEIAVSVVFGSLVSLNNRMFTMLLPPCTSYLQQLLYVVCGCLICGFGMLLYVNANVLTMPTEGFVKAIIHKTGNMHVSTGKMLLDTTCIIFSALFTLACTGLIFGLREGTLICAFGVGFSMRQFSKKFENPLQRYLNGQSKGGPRANADYL